MRPPHGRGGEDGGVGGGGQPRRMYTRFRQQGAQGMSTGPPAECCASVLRHCASSRVYIPETTSDGSTSPAPRPAHLARGEHCPARSRVTGHTGGSGPGCIAEEEAASGTGCACKSSAAAAVATASSVVGPGDGGASKRSGRRRSNACAAWRRTVRLMRWRANRACRDRSGPRGREDLASNCRNTRSAAGPQMPDGSNTIGTNIIPSLKHWRAVSRNERFVAS